VSQTQNALGIEMRDLLDVALLERLTLEEVDCRDVGLVRPLERQAPALATTQRTRLSRISITTGYRPDRGGYCNQRLLATT
jgi:hypothetical protein